MESFLLFAKYRTLDELFRSQPRSHMATAAARSSTCAASFLELSLSTYQTDRISISRLPLLVFASCKVKTFGHLVSCRRELRQTCLRRSTKMGWNRCGLEITRARVVIFKTQLIKTHDALTRGRKWATAR